MIVHNVTHFPSDELLTQVDDAELSKFTSHFYIVQEIIKGIRMAYRKHKQENIKVKVKIIIQSF